MIHDTLGSPMYPDGHVQTGSWLSTLQNALVAQGSVTAHGLRHFLLMQALCRGHSELSRHSGANTGTRSGVTETCKMSHNADFITKLTLQTLYSGVSRVSYWTWATRCMPSWLANCVGTTRIHITGIPACAINTLIRISTISISQAWWCWGY